VGSPEHGLDLAAPPRPRPASKSIAASPSIPQTTWTLDEYCHTEYARLQLDGREKG